MFYKKIFPYLLLLPFIVYSMRGGFYTSGGILSRAMVVVVLLMGFYFMIYCLIHYYHKLGSAVKCHLFLIVFATCSWIVSDKEIYGSYVGSVYTIDFMKNFLYPNLSFYIFYFLFKKYSISINMVLIWALLIAIGTYYNMLYERNLRLSLLTWDAQSVQIAMGYTFAIFIPYAYFIRKPLLRIGLAFLLFLITVSSAKRGAMVLGAMQLMMCYYKTFMIDNKRHRYAMILMGVFIGFVAIFLAWHYISQNDFVMNRLSKMEEGDTSNRSTMYSLMLNYCLSLSDIFKFMFGGGVIYTVKIIGDYAHNDWFESFINFGIIYTIVYLSFYVHLFVRMKKVCTDFKFIIASVILSLLFKSFLSMGIYSMDMFVSFMLLAYVFAFDYAKQNVGLRNYKLSK